MNYHLFEHEKIKVNMVFQKHEIKHFTFLWNEGYDIFTIAEKMKRGTTDIALLIVDRAEIGEIKKRSHGMF